jgi:hypothetical protein
VLQLRKLYSSVSDVKTSSPVEEFLICLLLNYAFNPVSLFTVRTELNDNQNKLLNIRIILKKYYIKVDIIRFFIGSNFTYYY